MVSQLVELSTDRENKWLGEGEVEAADLFFDPTSFCVLLCTSAFCKAANRAESVNASVWELNKYLNYQQYVGRIGY